MSIFGQVWLWSLLAFFVGALVAWLVLARPARKRVRELEAQLSTAQADSARAAASTPAQATASLPAGAGTGTAVLPPAEDWTRDQREHAPTEVFKAAAPTPAFSPEPEYDGRTAPEPAAARDEDDDVDEAFARAEAQEHPTGLLDSAPATEVVAPVEPPTGGNAYRAAATDYLQPVDRELDLGSHHTTEHDSGYHRIAEPPQPADSHDSGYHQLQEPAEPPTAFPTTEPDDSHGRFPLDDDGAEHRGAFEPVGESQGQFESAGEGRGAFEPAGEAHDQFESAGEGHSQFEQAGEGRGAFESAGEAHGQFEQAGEGRGAFEPVGEAHGQFESAGEGHGQFEQVSESHGLFEPLQESANRGAFESAGESSGHGSFEPAEENSGHSAFEPVGETGGRGAFEAAEETGGRSAFEPVEEEQRGAFEAPVSSGEIWREPAESVAPAEEPETGRRHLAEPVDGLSSLEHRLGPAPIEAAPESDEPVSLFRPGPRTQEPEPDWFNQPGVPQRSAFEEPQQDDGAVGHLEDAPAADHLTPGLPAESGESIEDSAQGLPKRQRRESPRGGFDPPRPIQPSMRSVERREPDVAGGHSGSLFEPSVQPNQVAMSAPEPPPARQAAADAVPPGPFGPGSAMPRPGGGRPADGFTVKASVTALRYCAEDSPQFPKMVAEVWFRTAADAERVGFRPLH